MQSVTNMLTRLFVQPSGQVVWKRYSWSALWLALSVAFIIVVFLVLCPAYIDVCEPAKDGAAEKCEPYNVLYFVLLQMGGFFRHAETWTALGTIAIAAFTLALKQSTDRLWKVTTNAEKARAKETEILQRAYLSAVPRGINPYLGSDSVVGHVGFKNAGNLPARNVRWFIEHSLDVSDDFDSFPIDETRFYGKNVIVPGSEITQGTYSFDMPEDGFIYVWGRILYDDGFGNERFTNFCHRYNRRTYRELESGRYGIPIEYAREHEYGNDGN
jgi:hypothetical protein